MRRRSAFRDDRGSTSAELALLAPVLILLMLLLVLAGRVTETEIHVDAAAYQAARSASLARSPAEAQQVAQDVVSANLRGLGAFCVAPTAQVDTARFVTGGVVRVTVACRTEFAGLGGLGVPGGVTLRSTASSPLDVFRGVTP